jgi:NTP pyrophosphatase (non-canonical NTP hydrolase)
VAPWREKSDRVTGRNPDRKFYSVNCTHSPGPDSQPMTLDEYQKLAARTIGTRTHADQLSNMALGLAGEAGETADMLKKHLFHGKPLDHDEVVKELGDVMWYVAGMATAIGISLDDVAQRNVDKLRKRYPDGFSAEASQKRADVVA